MPERLPYLEQVVAAIRPQVDEIRVYLNNFSEVPEFLSTDEGCLSDVAQGDMGAEGKFFWLNDPTDIGFSHYLTIDDDIGYPEDYVDRLLYEFEAREQQAIIGVHGSEFELPIEDFVTSRKERYRFYQGLDSPRAVHILGTATTLFSKQTLDLSLDDFPIRNASDLQLAITAQRQEVPMVAIPRTEGWMTELRPWQSEGYSIWKSTKAEGLSVEKTRLAQSAIEQWQLFPDPLSDVSEE